MCNVNVINRISCFWLIIFLIWDWRWLWPPWPTPGYAPGQSTPLGRSTGDYSIFINVAVAVSVGCSVGSDYHISDVI